VFRFIIEYNSFKGIWLSLFFIWGFFERCYLGSCWNLIEISYGVIISLSILGFFLKKRIFWRLYVFALWIIWVFVIILLP
jgi:hypothetical protein